MVIDSFSKLIIISSHKGPRKSLWLYSVTFRILNIQKKSIALLFEFELKRYLKILDFLQKLDHFFFFAMRYILWLVIIWI